MLTGRDCEEEVTIDYLANLPRDELLQLKMVQAGLPFLVHVYWSSHAAVATYLHDPFCCIDACMTVSFCDMPLYLFASMTVLK